MASWFDPGAKSLLTQWGSFYEMDNSKSKNVLGINYISCEDSIVALAECLI